MPPCPVRERLSGCGWFWVFAYERHKTPEPAKARVLHDRVGLWDGRGNRRTVFLEKVATPSIKNESDAGKFGPFREKKCASVHLCRSTMIILGLHRGWEGRIFYNRSTDHREWSRREGRGSRGGAAEWAHGKSGREAWSGAGIGTGHLHAR
jgi:hypothetical protein